VQVAHGNGDDANGDARRTRSVDGPLPTVCGTRGEWAVCEPFIVPNFGERDGQKPRVHSVDDPAPAVTGRGAGNLIEPKLLPQHGGGALRPVSSPAPTIACDGAVALVQPFLVHYYGNGGSDSVENPVATVTTRDRFGLVRPVVQVNGEKYELDILYRMLQPHELAGAQGFPLDYQFTGTKTEVVKQIGNAVPRRLARALVAAALKQDANVDWLCGFEPLWLPDFLFDFQRHLVEWAVRKGRAAIFADCGLGKTPCSSSGPRTSSAHEPAGADPDAAGRLAPDRPRGGEVRRRGHRSADGKPRPNITVTNYERLDKFDPDDYAGVVATRRRSSSTGPGRRRRPSPGSCPRCPTACSAPRRPAPNDYVEMGTRARPSAS
jgi:hypothetical protein